GRYSPWIEATLLVDLAHKIISGDTGTDSGLARNVNILTFGQVHSRGIGSRGDRCCLRIGLILICVPIHLPESDIETLLLELCPLDDSANEWGTALPFAKRSQRKQRDKQDNGDDNEHNDQANVRRKATRWQRPIFCSLYRLYTSNAHCACGSVRATCAFFIARNDHWTLHRARRGHSGL